MHHSGNYATTYTDIMSFLWNVTRWSWCWANLCQKGLSNVNFLTETTNSWLFWGDRGRTEKCNWAQFKNTTAVECRMGVMGGKNQELQKFLKDQGINVYCIQETHPTSSYRFSLRGYEIIWQAREDWPPWWTSECHQSHFLQYGKPIDLSQTVQNS